MASLVSITASPIGSYIAGFYVRLTMLYTVVPIFFAGIIASGMNIFGILLAENRFS